MSEQAAKITIGELEVLSLAETEELGRRLAGLIRPGDVLALDGDLGAGKTTLTAAIARGLGVREQVTSPTFALAQSYETEQFPLHHMDAYRLDGAAEFEGAGLAELCSEQAAVIVEWSERIAALLPKKALYIRIERKDGDSAFEIAADGRVVLPADTNRRLLCFSSYSSETAERFKEVLHGKN